MVQLLIDHGTTPNIRAGEWYSAGLLLRKSTRLLQYLLYGSHYKSFALMHSHFALEDSPEIFPRLRDRLQPRRDLLFEGT